MTPLGYRHIVLFGAILSVYVNAYSSSSSHAFSLSPSKNVKVSYLNNADDDDDILQHHHRKRRQANRNTFQLSADASTVTEKVTTNTTTTTTTTPPTFEDPFTVICNLAVSCVHHSDLQKNAGGAGAGNKWIDDRTSFILTKAIDRITLRLAQDRTTTTTATTGGTTTVGGGSDRDEASTWIRWMRSAPTPTIVDLTDDFRTVANRTLTAVTGRADDPDNVLGRLGCRIVLLPSGASLTAPLVEPPQSLVLGKLLYGGVTRYRELGSSGGGRGRGRAPRRTGEVTEVKKMVGDNPPGWTQFGGANRVYEGVDMGPAAVLEVLFVPQGITRWR